MSRARLSHFFAHLKLFHIGLSWGGYESLVLPVELPLRTASPLDLQGSLLRVHAGLEDVDDLAQDFRDALDAACQAHPA
jgi:cystathionine beta-lyase